MPTRSPYVPARRTAALLMLIFAWCVGLHLAPSVHAALGSSGSAAVAMDSFAYDGQSVAKTSAPNTRIDATRGETRLTGASRSSTSLNSLRLAAKAGSEDDHIVLGLRAFDLEGAAAKAGGRTLLDDPAYRETLQQAVGDSSTTFTVSLDGLHGGYTYDAADQLRTGPSATFTYDTLGQRIASTQAGVGTNYTYGQAGRLTSATGSAPTTYTYDADNLRATKTSGVTTARYTWTASGGLAQLLSDGSASYIYGPDAIALEQIDSAGTVSYIHHDQLGSTRLLTNAAGNTVAKFTYDPYGTLAASTGSAHTPLGYAGQYTDPETGLIYLRARYYDPSTAQFLTRDPLAALTRQPYGYASNNPLNTTDPSGLAPQCPTDEAGEDGTTDEDEAADAELTTGGIGPVLKGQAGVARAIGELEAEGAEVLGRGEITISTPVGRTRIDLAQRTSEGDVRFVEVKNGPSARPNPNQQRVFEYIRRDGGTPVGRRARQAGFEPGEPIGPTPVDVRSYGE